MTQNFAGINFLLFNHKYIFFKPAFYTFFLVTPLHFIIITLKEITCVLKQQNFSKL